MPQQFDRRGIVRRLGAIVLNPNQLIHRVPSSEEQQSDTAAVSLAPEQGRCHEWKTFRRKWNSCRLRIPRSSPASRAVRGIAIESSQANMPSSRTMHGLISKEVPLLMRKQVHTRRAALVLTALVIAAAFPMMLPSREHAASAEVVMMETTNTMIVADSAASATIPECDIYWRYSGRRERCRADCSDDAGRHAVDWHRLSGAACRVSSG